MHAVSRSPLQRFAHIDQAVRSGRWPNGPKLATELEVSVRTIYRDIEFMRDRLHAPVSYDANRKGFYYTNQSFRLPGFAVSEGEYLALFLAERLLQQYRGTSFASDIARLFRKVTDLLPAPVMIDLDHLNEQVSFRHQGIEPGDIRRFEQLHRSIREGRQLEIVYWTASRDVTGRRLIDPYHLASIDGDWYLAAYCHLREEVRLFSPSRIRELRETGESFERPADFRINEYLDVGFRKMRGAGPMEIVRLLFTPQAARYVREKVWHPTQKLREHADGSLTLTFRVNHLLEVKRWVLSFGADCEVLGPKILQQQICTELEEMVVRSRGNAFRHHY